MSYIVLYKRDFLYVILRTEENYETGENCDVSLLQKKQILFLYCAYLCHIYQSRFKLSNAIEFEIQIVFNSIQYTYVFV